jgi:prepilin-type N-terminal cleavage/methylation domain-containing protein
MNIASTKSTRGFSLMEMMIALAVGLVVLASAVQLFSQGVDATWVISQRAEMQQDLRATSDLLLKDISLAGSGLPLGQGVQLPTNTGTRPIYGCDQGNNCPPNGAVAYPCSSNAGPCVPTLFGIIPGYQLGIVPPGGAGKTDLITVVYSDTIFALNCYTVTFPGGGAVNPVTFTAPANPPPASCVLPPGVVFPQSITDQVVGLKAGDLLLFQNTVGGATGQAVAEVSNAGCGPVAFCVNFLNGDPLKLNQSAAPSGDLANIVGGVGTTASRIFVITYYLKTQPDPAGIGPGFPVLMRQVNGQPAVPVTENVANLQFTYDTYDSSGNLLNQVGDAGYSTGTSFNLIRKINVVHLSIRSQLAGVRSALIATKGYQSFDFQTSISARNLSYQNRYNLQ